MRSEIEETNRGEVISLSDRVVVMYGGKIVGIIPRGQAEVRKIGLMMGRAS